MRALPIPAATRISGVSTGRATTSKTVSAMAITSSGKASASASAPFMPSGVALMIRGAVPSISGLQSKP